MYYLLTSNFKELEQQITDLIVKVVAPEKIFFLGSTLMRRRTESLFMPEAPSCQYPAHYYFLVLMAHSAEHTCSWVQDKIENNCQHLVPVTAMVLEAEGFNEWFRQGHPFACRVKDHAALLYDAENIFLELPAAADEVKWENTQRTLYTLGLGRVRDFLAGADLFIVRKQYQLAAFLLHQAAEQALLTLFRIATGLRVNTHNLDKLLRYCSMITYRLPELFPTQKGKDKHCFGLLQRAYIDTRYKEEYNIGLSEVELLRLRVGSLLELLEEQKPNKSAAPEPGEIDQPTVAALNMNADGGE